MPGELAVQNPVTSLLQLMDVAVQNKAQIDVLERLAAMLKEERAFQAELEFNQAMQRTQEQIRRIGVDASNPQTHSKYATYAKLDGVLRPIYTKEGFSLSFDTEPVERLDIVRVLCYVSRGGHTRTYRIDMPSDGKGPKGNDVMSKTHATGAAVSYGSRYLLKLIFNVSVGETDDDGNGATVTPMEEKSFDEWKSHIESASDLEDLKKRYFEAKAAAGTDMRAAESFRDIAGKRKNQILGAKR